MRDGAEDGVMNASCDIGGDGQKSEMYKWRSVVYKTAQTGMYKSHV
jgi:hypothetical protein